MAGVPLADLARVAREAEELGYTDAWSSEVDGIDAFTPLCVIGGATNMRLGTAIVNVYTRGPQTLASSVAGLAELAPGRFVLGIGSGSQPIIERWNGVKFEKPVTRVREMAQFLKQALTGERVVFEGETIRVNGFRLSAPPEKPVPIHIAGLRSGMLRAAGQVADGAIVNWLSAEDVKKSVAVVREAASEAGRDPASIEITARLIVNLDPVTKESTDGLKRAVTTYLNVPVYRKFHEWLGRTEELAGMWNAWDAGDRKASLDAVPDTLIDELMIRGTPEERNAGVRAYMDAGVDTAFLSFGTSEPDPGKRRAIVMQALRDMAPVTAGAGT
ncbi:MAG: LLM class F420-dependent oxidoreductase [Dehalococcoidia bacterium]|nr:LLM class F420-dependent oxidoreductase [Dehalococcoidia bacterium]